MISHESYPLDEINTGTIFCYLNEHDQKWKNYDRTFLKETFQNAIKLALWDKGIVSIPYDGTNGGYLQNYRDVYKQDEKNCSESSDLFPFPDYFLRFDPKSDNFSLIEYDEPCPIKKNESDFDLFFALQFSLTDIVDGDQLPATDFLKYQLKYTFENDISEFKYYLNSLCLKYKFLKGDHETVIQQFFDRMKEQEKTTVPAQNIEKLKWLGTPSQFAYLMLELVGKGFIDPPSTSGDVSYSKYAKVCWELFDFQSKTTAENLRKEMNPNKNSLSDSTRAKFTIPDLKDISKK